MTNPILGRLLTKANTYAKFSVAQTKSKVNPESAPVGWRAEDLKWSPLHCDNVFKGGSLARGRGIMAGVQMLVCIMVSGEDVKGEDGMELIVGECRYE